MFAGTPDQVFAQIKKIYDHVGGFGHLLIMGQAGFLEHDETVHGIKMLRARGLSAAQGGVSRHRDLGRAQERVVASSRTAYEIAGIILGLDSKAAR